MKCSLALELSSMSLNAWENTVDHFVWLKAIEPEVDLRSRQRRTETVGVTTMNKTTRKDKDATWGDSSKKDGGRRKKIDTAKKNDEGID